MHPPWPGSNILHLPRQRFIEPTGLRWESVVAPTGTVWLVGRDKSGCDIARFPARVTNLNYQRCDELKEVARHKSFDEQAEIGMRLWQYRLKNDLLPRMDT